MAPHKIREDFMFDMEFYRGRKVFITGHTGFKGSWMCALLAMAGAEVTGYALKPPTDPSLFDMLHLSEKILHQRGCPGSGGTENSF